MIQGATQRGPVSREEAFGLAGGVWTRDVGRAHQVARTIRPGVVWVNTYGNFDPAMPFGGDKASGWGRELGDDAIDEYTSVKAVWVRTGD
ncbi:MAG TPA: aldehyde dehydrogenase family protein [Acidimicrobiales bacterium]|nr:aldehyde dehydrogenase family protein [Acidimicrobiales bacterium]